MKFHTYFLMLDEEEDSFVISIKTGAHRQWKHDPGNQKTHLIQILNSFIVREDDLQLEKGFFSLCWVAVKPPSRQNPKSCLL